MSGFFAILKRGKGDHRCNDRLKPKRAVAKDGKWKAAFTDSIREKSGERRSGCRARIREMRCAVGRRYRYRGAAARAFGRIWGRSAEFCNADFRARPSLLK